MLTLKLGGCLSLEGYGGRGKGRNEKALVARGGDNLGLISTSTIDILRLMVCLVWIHENIVFLILEWGVSE